MSILLDLVKNLAIQRGIGSLEKRIGQYYSNGDDDTNQFTSNQKDMGLGSILGRTAAFGLLGPILGPIAFALGKGIMSRRNRMSLTDDSIITPGPKSGKVTTLDGKTVDFGSDEYVADMKARDKAFQETGDYDVYSDTPTSGPTYSPPDPSTYSYEGSDEQDEASNYGGGNGGSSSASTAGDAPGYSGPSPFRYGGLASLYR